MSASHEGVSIKNHFWLRQHYTGQHSPHRLSIDRVRFYPRRGRTHERRRNPGSMHGETLDRCTNGGLLTRSCINIPYRENCSRSWEGIAAPNDDDDDDDGLFQPSGTEMNLCKHQTRGRLNMSCAHSSLHMEHSPKSFSIDL